MGLDLGSKTCGVAISDGLGMYAHPYETIYFQDEDIDLLKEPLKVIIEKEKIKGIALGFPKMMNNDIGIRAVISQEFQTKLQEWFGIEVRLMDERLTSVIATKKLIGQDMSRKNRKKVVDQQAAVEILQTYLDRLKFEEAYND